MSRVKNSAPSDPPALPKSEDTLDSVSPFDFQYGRSRSPFRTQP